MIVEEKIDKNFLKQYNVKSLFEISLIKNLLNNDFWIAGGFPRMLYSLYEGYKDKKLDYANDLDLSLELSRKKVIDYFKSDMGDKKGDIDFFTSKENYSNWHSNFSKDDVSARNKRQYKRFLVDESEFAENFIFYKDRVSCFSTLTVQVVNKFFYTGIEDCFKAFDFDNCKYAIVKKQKEIFFVYESSARKYDKQRVLSIQNSNSPLLCKRILKYLSGRNLSTVAEHSFKHINDFLYKLSSNYWPLSDAQKKYTIQEDLKRIDENVYPIPEEMLSILILASNCKNKNNISYRYGPKISVDWMLEKLKNN